MASGETANTQEKKIRVIIGKMGLDGHYRGAVVLSTLLQEAGMEVIYTGLYQTPEMIVATAIQEDADVIGLSFLAGEQLYYAPRVVQLLKEKNLHDVVVIVGGVIPRRDITELRKAGIMEVFLPGTPVQDIVNYITQTVHELRS